MIKAGLTLAAKHGFDRVSRDMVARHIGCSPALLSRYWTAPQFHACLMEFAVMQNNLPVIAQGLAARHPAALAAPLEIRQAAAASLLA